MGAGALGTRGVGTEHVQRHVDLGKDLDIERDSALILSQNTEEYPAMGKVKTRIQTSATPNTVNVRVGFLPALSEYAIVSDE